MPVRVGIAAVAVAGALTACGGTVVDAGRPRPPTAPALTPFCLAAQDSTAALRPLAALSRASAVPPEQLAAAVDAVRRSNTQLVATAPPQLRADVQRMVDVVNAQLDALVRARGDALAVPRDPAAAGAAADPEAAAAAQRVTAYVSRSCPSTQ